MITFRSSVPSSIRCTTMSTITLGTNQNTPRLPYMKNKWKLSSVIKMLRFSMNQRLLTPRKPFNTKSLLKRPPKPKLFILKSNLTQYTQYVIIKKKGPTQVQKSKCPQSRIRLRRRAETPTRTSYGCSFEGSVKEWRLSQS